MELPSLLLSSTIAIGLLLSAAGAHATLDLTPAAADYTAEGIKHHQLTFRDDKRRIEYEPPAGWKFGGGSNQLRLTPPKDFAEAIVNVTPASKPQSFDETAIKLLEEQLLAALPVGNQFSKIEEATANPVLLGGNESFEVTLSYQLMGEKFVRSVLVVNLKDEQLVFRLTAKKNDFSGLHRDFKTSLMTWQWVEQGEVASAQ